MKFALLFLASALAFADGGSVLLKQQSGPFLITVFGNPQVGLADLSVLVQNATDRSPILDADVQVRLGDITILATHDQATNKLLYAALVKVSHPGPSQLYVVVTYGAQSTTINGNINVGPSPAPWLTYWPYFGLVPAAILLFALNQWLKARRLKRPAAPP